MAPKLSEIEFPSIFDASVVDSSWIFIEYADPGFDFIFYHNIKGVVTKYVGSNSHMAIRCMELGIPAVIGPAIRTNLRRL